MGGWMDIHIQIDRYRVSPRPVKSLSKLPWLLNRVGKYERKLQNVPIQAGAEPQSSLLSRWSRNREQFTHIQDLAL